MKVMRPENQTRRQLLKGFCALALLPVVQLAQAWNKLAFEADKQAESEKILKMTALTQSDAITVIAPDRAENGAVVQVAFKSDMPNIESMTLLVENNPTPLIARFLMEKGVKADFTTRIKMAETSNVKVVVKAGGEFFYNTKKVQVMENGCGGEVNTLDFVSSMKMRARLKEKYTQVKSIIVHPMSTGRAKNSAGELVPAQFIQTIDVSLNQQPKLQVQTSTAIAKNPYLTFYFTDAKSGDVIQMAWLDNKGRSGKGEVIISS